MQPSAPAPRSTRASCPLSSFCLGSRPRPKTGGSRAACCRPRRPTPAAKEGESDRAASGSVGRETAVAVALDRLVRPGLLPLATLIARWSRDPARLLNLPGGTLSAGAVADVTILDLDTETTVDPSRFHSRSRNTPFGGWQ